MPAASILIKPASSNCNINCRYCFYKCLSSNREEYSKGFMSDETLESTVKQAFDYADGLVTFAFQGGEPTLAGLDFYKKLIELQKKYNYKNIQVENTIQTNGILIDEEWAEFLSENHFLTGISLDGTRKMHDIYRRSVTGEPTFEKVMNAISLLKAHKADFNILTVITENTCGKASALYKFFKRNCFSFVQLIPCMDEPERFSNVQRDSSTENASASCLESVEINSSPFGVKPESYGEFLCDFFDLWYEDFMKGSDMNVRMFSNLAQMAAGYPSEECGMSGKCSCYFVVEGDGSVYPCDFYCTDEWKLGDVNDSFKTLIKSERALRFVKESEEKAPDCVSCPYLALCRGGCRRWRQMRFGGSIEKNFLCRAYTIFFGHTWERLEKLGDLIVSKYGRGSYKE